MAAPVKVLVIDDNEDDRLLYRRTLGKVPGVEYRVLEAADGEEGLRIIDKEKPACVLLDYSLPGRNGIEILKAIRGRHPFIAVVILTGQGSERVAVDAMQEGAQNYIAKSTITPEAFGLVIRMAMERCQLQKRVHEQRTALEIFTRALAHDLKEPVRTIRSFADLIRQDEIFSEKTAGRFEHIQHAADRMHMLIDSVFFYTRLDAPDQAMREICPVSDVVKEAQDNLAELIRERRTTIQPGALPRIHANRIQLMQVLQNLISNAIHHSEQPVTIRIQAEEQPEHWLFSVSDSGPGVEKDYLEKIFEPFRRLTNKEEQGAGLGLAICQRIIESHGGRIWCESEFGKGATFLFTLPKALPQAQAEPVSQVVAPAKADTMANGHALANVLLVDDNRADIEIAKIMLLDAAQMQCNLSVARGGEEALTLLQQGNAQQKPIDLVLLDINMPEMNGFELLEKIRKDDALKQTAVVMCTGSIYDKDMERSRRLGAIGYLNKPIEFVKLKSIIDAEGRFQLRQQNDHYLLLRAA